MCQTESLLFSNIIALFDQDHILAIAWNAQGSVDIVTPYPMQNEYIERIDGS